MSLSPAAHARLVTLFNLGTTPCYMTGEEGQELGALGLIQADPSQLDPSNPMACRVSITEQGINALNTPPAAAPAVAPVAPALTFVVQTGISIPTATRRGGANNLKPRKSQYPFDELPDPVIDPATGQPQYASFHVACTEASPEPWKAMASNVSAANRRFEVEVKDANGQPVMETVEKKTLIKGADKKPMLDSNGNKQYKTEQVVQAKTVATKKFIARRVGKDDPNGEGVRIFRVPLDF
jgi:hypothetical protein